MNSLLQVINKLHVIPVIEGVAPSVRIAIINCCIMLLPVLWLKVPGITIKVNQKDSWRLFAQNLDNADLVTYKRSKFMIGGGLRTF